MFEDSSEDTGKILKVFQLKVQYPPRLKKKINTGNKEEKRTERDAQMTTFIIVRTKTKINT